MNLFKALIMILATLPLICHSTIKHHILDLSGKDERMYVWEEEGLSLFDELILSWGAERPSKGGYLIQVSIKLEEWTPWVDYAYWGENEQYTFNSATPQRDIQVEQDILEINGGKYGDGCRVRLKAEGEVTLDHFRSLHLSMIDRSKHTLDAGELRGAKSLFLGVPGISQMVLEDDRRMRLCSPTSTTAVIHYLLDSSTPSPVAFADGVCDSAFDIYGNWALNTSHASSLLGKEWCCFAARLSTFEQVLDQLKQNCPVVVSIKGEISGGALPYQSGHLMVVTGYDVERQQVCCMDPAFDADEKTHVRYELGSFLEVWGRRQGLAYIFQERSRIAS